MKIQKQIAESIITEEEKLNSDVIVIHSDESKQSAEKKIDELIDNSGADLTKAEEDEWKGLFDGRKLKAGMTVGHSGDGNSIGTKNAITDALDECLELALRARDINDTETRANIRIIGLPGSGKTASVYEWAKRTEGGKWEYKMIWDDNADEGNGGWVKKRRPIKGSKKVNVVYLNMKNNDLDAFINGYTIHRDAKDDSDDEFGKVGQAYSSNLDSLDKPNSIVFLDEYTRQKDDQIRGSVLTLINEHYIAGKDHGKRYFPNFLFTIAVENPKSAGDNGVAHTNQAERTRFDTTLDHIDSDVPTTLDYLNKNWMKKIKEELKYEDTDYDLIESWLRILHLGTTILNDDRFKFDTEPEVMDELDELGCNALNSRVFCTMIENRGWKKDLSGLKNWIETKSKLLPVDVEVAVYDKNGQFVENEIHKATKQMLLDIINDYYIPTREELFRQYGIKEEVPADDEAKETVPEASAEDDAAADVKQDPEVTADAADEKDVELEDDPDAEDIIDSSKMYGAANGGLAGQTITPSRAQGKDKVNDFRKRVGI